MAYVAAFGFRYNGRYLLRQELLRKLDGCINDRKLVTSRYLREVSAEELKHSIKCDGCGREFLTDSATQSHRREGLCTQDPEILSKARRSDSEVIAALPDDKRKQLER